MKTNRKPKKKIVYITTFLILLIIIGSFIAWHQSTNYILSLLSTSTVSSKDPTGSPQEKKSPTASIPETKDQSTPTTATTPQTKDFEPASPNEAQKAQTSESKDNEKDQKEQQKEQAPSSTTPQQDTTPTTNKDSNSSDFTYSPGISTEKAQKVQDSITLSEKAQVTSVLLKKLSAKELNLFIKMASGGLTVEEKKEAKKIILEKLTEEEYNQLIGIAAKYGLSQGKNYSESQKEKR